MKSIISRDTKLVLVAEAVKTLIFDGEFGFDMISSHNLFGLENKNYQTWIFSWSKSLNIKS